MVHTSSPKETLNESSTDELLKLIETKSRSRRARRALELLTERNRKLREENLKLFTEIKTQFSEILESGYADAINSSISEVS